MANIISRIRSEKILIYIRSSLWFVPSLVILTAAILASALVSVDHSHGERIYALWPWLSTTGPEAARAMLTAIAGSMATVAGVVFSITIVALALASSQYTPRVLRNFMRDRANQVVLGVFVGVYTYCLLVLRSISGGEQAMVPSLALLGSLILAITAIGFFIFFIHHISTSIQVSDIAASITSETLEVIDRLFPEQAGEDSHQDPPPELCENIKWQCIPSLDMGYLQSIDTESLVQFAREQQTVVKMACGIGDFIAPGAALAWCTVNTPPDEATIRQFNRIYAIAPFRTIEQDAAFGFRQLVDISLKALSPGINDTTTAITCLDHLSVLLCRCAQRCMPPPYHYDRGQLRIIASVVSFADFASLTFRQILENAEGNSEVLIRMLWVIRQTAGAARSRQRCKDLKIWVFAIEETANRSIKSGHALHAIEQALAATRVALDANPEAEQAM